MTVAVEQARDARVDLIDRTTRGEMFHITRDDQPVAELVADDEEHLEHVKDYLP